MNILNEKYPDLKSTVIEEVGIIYLNRPANQEKEINLSKVNREISQYIEIAGELPKLVFEPSKSETGPMEKKSITSTKKTKKMGTRSVLPPLSSPIFNAFNWYLREVTNNFKTYSLSKSNQSVSIALIDSGVDTSHPLLKDHIDLNDSKSYVPNENSIFDSSGHGTQVAGILTSIAPNAKIVPYKVLGKTDGESVWVIDAIIDAAQNDSDVINLSLGTYKAKNEKEEKLLIKAYDRAVKFADKSGSVIVASSGNDSLDLDELKKEKTMHLPGGMHSLITVSSNMKNDELAPYSNYGKEIDLVAPGGYFSPNYNENGKIDIREMIITTVPINRPNSPLDQAIGLPRGYTLSFGTSLSAPQVSATAALIIAEYEKKKGKTPNANKVMKYLKKGAIDIGPKGKDDKFGIGEINAFNSLSIIENKKDKKQKRQN